MIYRENKYEDLHLPVKLLALNLEKDYHAKLKERDQLSKRVEREELMYNKLINSKHA